MNKIVDYNSISSEYNKRYSSNSMLGIQSALTRLIKNYNPKTALEVGCGTGRWLQEFDSNSTKIIGLDYSIGMLQEASKLQSASLIRGDANFLPIKQNYFDLIYCVNAIHHFKNSLRFVYDSKEFLRSNGILCIIGLDHHEEPMDWYIYDYFDGIFEYDKQRFPSFSKINHAMNSVGFTDINIQIIDKVNIIRTGSEIFNDPFLAKEQSSQLAVLSQEEYMRGIEKIKLKIKSKANQQFNVRFFVKMITGSLSGSN